MLIIAPDQTAFRFSLTLMAICHMFSLESPHRGYSNEYTQHTVINIKMKTTRNYPKYINVCSFGIFCQGLKNEFEIAVVNEPSVFEPPKFYCICKYIFYLFLSTTSTGLILGITLPVSLLLLILIVCCRIGARRRALTRQTIVTVPTRGVIVTRTSKLFWLFHSRKTVYSITLRSHCGTTDGFTTLRFHLVPSKLAKSILSRSLENCMENCSKLILVTPS